ncbi:MAG: DoxX family membrane protein, partial [Deltaproteobacteria bacterium]|nr:DoxX family membrane protein [Deltaproteobacteria bacterium]
MLKLVLRAVVGLGMIAIGVMHFVNPEPFVRIVPDVLPAPLALVYISGFFEIAGGLGLLWSRTRRLASLGLVALYLAVFPANINMAVNEIQLSPGGDMPVWAMWA